MDCSAPVRAPVLCSSTESPPAGICQKVSKQKLDANFKDDIEAKPPDIFGRWLKAKLASEREALVSQMQELVLQHLNDHHRAMLEDLEARLHATKLSLPVAIPGAQLGQRDSQRVERAFDPATSSVNSLGTHRRGSDCSSITESVNCRRPDENGVANTPQTCGQMSSDNTRPKQTLVKSVTVAFKRLVGKPPKKEFATERFTSLDPTASEPQAAQRICSRFVRSWVFEAASACLILANTIVMATEVQYSGYQIGHALGHPTCSLSPEEAWPGAAAVFDLATFVFACLFFLELLCRVLDMGATALCSGWIWLDAAILAFGCMDLLDRFGSGLTFNINPSVIRLARLARMFRTLKLLKHQETFQSLFLLIKSLQASARALFWSCFLLFSVQIMAGVLINQMLFSYFQEPGAAKEVFEYFGTFTRMFITMFEITLGNWAPPKRALMVSVSEWWGLYVVLYRCVLCFAIVSVTSAVFVAETTRAASSDDEVAIMNKSRMRKATMKKLEALFSELDHSGDGHITWDEFQYLMYDDIMKQFLGTLQLEIGDAQDLFRLLDDGDGRVMRDEFIHGIMTMRGEAKSIDLIILLKMARKMDRKIDRLVRRNG